MLMAGRSSELVKALLHLEEVEVGIACDKMWKSGWKERSKGLSKHVVV
jgi:hypothetical protein